MTKLKTLILCDIDGTIADAGHRMHFIKRSEIPADWDSFFDACVDDKPINDMIQLVRLLDSMGFTIVYLSGRSDRVRTQTHDWLRLHMLPKGRLMMRKAGDHRPDFIVKSELLLDFHAEYETDNTEIFMSLDDRQQVVDMWRRQGIRCLQVAAGDF